MVLYKKNFIFLSLLMLVNFTTASSDGDLVINIDEFGNVTVANNLINVTFGSNADVLSLIKDGIDLVGTVTQRTFYFDWNAGGGKFSLTNFSIIRNTSDIIHIMYFQPFSNNHLELEYHIEFHKNLSGFYQWLQAKHTNETLSINWSEFRMIYRLSVSLITSMSNMVRKGDIPKISKRPTIQDTTWQMADGSYWSKYDYVGYIRETSWFGLYGGGVGAWVISASHEYHAGGPLKQDLLTQHYTLMCHYLTSSHFGSGSFSPEYGWSKVYGPWMLYVNSGSEDEMLEDVARQANDEKSQWPYAWLDAPNYPLERGTVRGRVTGQPRAEVVLHDEIDEYFEWQTKGYLFHNKTDENGNFVIRNVRPGRYVLSVYPLRGHGSENLITRNVSIVAGNQRIEDIELNEPKNLIWTIGETNKRADDFKYSDELRNFYWHTLPPENLTFYVGQSNSTRDWYYAQTHNGTWTIVFDDSPDGLNRTLRIAIAAASGSLIFNITSAKLQVDVNGVVILEKEYENDKSIYRGALQSGKYYFEKLLIPADLVSNGKNKIGFTISYGSFMYDAISYQRNVIENRKNSL